MTQSSRILLAPTDAEQLLELRPLVARLELVPELELVSVSPDETCAGELYLGHGPPPEGVRAHGSVRLPRVLGSPEPARDEHPWSLVCLAGVASARPRSGRPIVTGVPRLDPLARGGRPVEALLELGLDAHLPTLLLSLDPADHDRLVAALAALNDRGPWNLVVDPGPVAVDRARLEPLEDVRLRLTQDSELVTYLGCADLLLTDRADLARAYGLRDRPVLLLDSTARRAAELGARRARPGDLAQQVRTALLDPSHLAPTRRLSSSSHYFDCGAATERVAAVVLEALGRRLDGPAGREPVDHAAAPSPRGRAKAE